MIWSASGQAALVLGCRAPHGALPELADIERLRLPVVGWERTTDGHVLPVLPYHGEQMTWVLLELSGGHSYLHVAEGETYETLHDALEAFADWWSV